MKINLLSIVLLFISSNITFAQESYWIQEYDLRKDNNRNDYFKSYKDYNRTIFKQTKDSLFFYDAGKQSWEERFNLGLKYEIQKDSLVIQSPRKKIKGYILKDTLNIFVDANRTEKFRRIKKVKKINSKKIRKIIFDNKFIVNPSEIDRILYDNGNKEISFVQFYKNTEEEKNVIRSLIVNINDYYFLIMQNLGGDKIHQIIKYDKKGFSIFCPNKEKDIVTFKVTK